jgi:hypothetical protein
MSHNTVTRTTAQAVSDGFSSNRLGFNLWEVHAEFMGFLRVLKFTPDNQFTNSSQLLITIPGVYNRPHTTSVLEEFKIG